MKSTLPWTASLGALLLLHACYSEPNGGAGSEPPPSDVADMSSPGTAPASMKSLRITGLLSTSTSPGVLHIDGDNLSGWNYKLCGASSALPFKGTASASAVELLVKLDELNSLSQNSTACVLPYRADGQMGEPRLVPWYLDDPIAFMPKSPVTANLPRLSMVPEKGGLTQQIVANSEHSVLFNGVSLSVAATDYIRDFTLVDINRDQVADFVVLTIDPKNSGITQYALNAYYWLGKADAPLDPAKGVKIPLAQVVPDPQEASCTVEDASARMAVLDLNGNGKVDITAQWRCPGVPGANNGLGRWSAVYATLQ
ncbi:hypothetical protein [Haliangium sp. UPWRP_2]|uniref:hypothetical protein n=1 Tax=Haliangium sp. UPWRP_2 TaxID=1931276 RepID=UPI0011B25CF7|nr:hypothetical protein [Haliangium sp. UPWRP_2]HNN97464.1 hypothetical protein [Pseudomonadota bacterium]